MKILWIVNTIFPYPSKMLGNKENVFGGWMMGLKNSLENKSNIKLAIATTYDRNKLEKFDDGNVIYYLLPCKNNQKYDAGLEKYWEQVNEDFKPDIVHLHGTEFAHGLSFMNACPNVKSVISIQGLVSLYGELYLMNISRKDVVRNITFRDIVKCDNMSQAKNNFMKRGKYEIEMLKKAIAIIGRTSWDYSATMSITDSSKYYKCNESLRDSFYDKQWDYSKVEKHTIFVSQASYPIKGFHELIRAIPIVKRYYKDIKVYVAGANIIDTPTFKSKLRMTGYAKYIKKLIEKYEVSDDIKFVGLLNEKQMVDQLLKCNVFVQTSVIENSPNSLGEAMILGMPIVASNVGGTSDMLIDKKEGYLYPYGEENLLAKYIIDVFNMGNGVHEMCDSARKHALKTHDRNKNANDMIEIYRSIVNENKK